MLRAFTFSSELKSKTGMVRKRKREKTTDLFACRGEKMNKFRALANFAI